MKKQKAREVIVEYEEVRIVRKRTQTIFLFCERCKTETDFLELEKAEAIFNTNARSLLRFIKEANCHLHPQNAEKTLICLNSLLKKMKQKLFLAGKTSPLKNISE